MWFKDTIRVDIRRWSEVLKEEVKGRRGIREIERLIIMIVQHEGKMLIGKWN